mmetsp:Transcript_18136/g.47831  ORF Transcript_18136/g.47831 Transcript_18136/m.47831 type:complete len:250 (+) Transcript_18136:367-1116(+)
MRRGLGAIRDRGVEQNRRHPAPHRLRLRAGQRDRRHLPQRRHRARPLGLLRHAALGALRRPGGQALVRLLRGPPAGACADARAPSGAAPGRCPPADAGTNRGGAHAGGERAPGGHDWHPRGGGCFVHTRAVRGGPLGGRLPAAAGRRRGGDGLRRGLGRGAEDAERRGRCDPPGVPHDLRVPCRLHVDAAGCDERVIDHCGPRPDNDLGRRRPGARHGHDGSARRPRELAGRPARVRSERRVLRHPGAV